MGTSLQQATRFKQRLSVFINLNVQIFEIFYCLQQKIHFILFFQVTLPD